MDRGVAELAKASRQCHVVFGQQEWRGQDQIRDSMPQRRTRTLRRFGKDQFGPEPAND